MTETIAAWARALPAHPLDGSYTVTDDDLARLRKQLDAPVGTPLRGVLTASLTQHAAHLSDDGLELLVDFARRLRACDQRYGPLDWATFQEAKPVAASVEELLDGFTYMTKVLKDLQRRGVA